MCIESIFTNELERLLYNSPGSLTTLTSTSCQHWFLHAILHNLCNSVHSYGFDDDWLCEEEAKVVSQSEFSSSPLHGKYSCLHEGWDLAAPPVVMTLMVVALVV